MPLTLAAHTLRRRPRPHRALVRRLARVDRGLMAFDRVLVDLVASMTTFCNLFERYLLWRGRVWK